MMVLPNDGLERLRYEITVLLGPCTEDEACEAMSAAAEATAYLGCGIALRIYDESAEEPAR